MEMDDAIVIDEESKRESRASLGRLGTTTPANCLEMVEKARREGRPIVWVGIDPGHRVIVTVIAAKEGTHCGHSDKESCVLCEHTFALSSDGVSILSKLCSADSSRFSSQGTTGCQVRGRHGIRTWRKPVVSNRKFGLSASRKSLPGCNQV